MKILKIHIENFGKLSDFTMNFTQGYNAICNDNGSGKSTLAAFIRVMFYGFEGERKRKGLNERTFYNPWQGGIYGGQLTFQTRGRAYVVSRVFGSKESEDVFELRDGVTNSLSMDFSQNIGRELFEIDSESFMRTVFISGSEIDTETTGDINAKMGNLTDNTEDLTDYDSAAATIKDLLNSMDPGKKRGSIKQMKDRITELEGQASRENLIGRDIDQLRDKMYLEKEKIANLNSSKWEIEKDRKMVEQFRECSVLIDKYQELENRYDQAKEQLNEAKALMNGIVPNKGELDQMQVMAMEMTNAKSEAVSTKLRERETERFLALQKKFAGKSLPLDEGDFTKIREKIDNLLVLRERQRMVRLSDVQQETLNHYRNLYGSSEKLNDETENMAVTFEKYKKSQARLEEIKKQIKERKKHGNRHNTSSQILNILIFLCCSIIAISVFFMDSYMSESLVISLVSVILIIVFASRKSNYIKDKNNLMEKIHMLEETIGTDQNNIDTMAMELAKVLETDEISEEALVEAVKKRGLIAEEFRNLEDKEAIVEKEASSAECMMVATEIAQFLNRWGVLEDEKHFGQSLDLLERQWRDYKALREDIGEFEYRKERYFDKRRTVENYLISLGIRPSDDIQGQVMLLKERYSNYVHKEENFLREKERIEAFDKEYNIKSLENLVNSSWREDLNNLDLKQEENIENIHKAQENIQQIQREMEVLKGQQEQVKTAGEELLLLYRKKDEESKKFRLLKYTGEILAEAKENLTARYSKPLKESYDKYFKMLSGLDGDDYHIDSNGVLTVKEQGLQRQVSSFSSGYKDMMGICMRLAFIDVMYPDEKPVVILDDPFINLDKMKVHKGKELLEKLSETYQVIYLTCNEDRQ